MTYISFATAPPGELTRTHEPLCANIQLKLKICTTPIRRLAVVFVFAVVRQRLDAVKCCKMYSVDVGVVKNKVCA